MGSSDCGNHGHSWCGHSWCGHSWCGHSCCGHSCCGHEWYEHLHPFLYCLAAFIIVICLIVLIIFLVLRPTKPSFALQDASILQFNLSASSFLTSTLQATLFSRNPNDRIGVYYDSLAVYASYKDQQITFPAQLPPSYQASNDVSVWSPYLYGLEVPIAPYLATSLAQEKGSGILLLHVKVDGKVRWRVGSWISGTYHINVNCPAIFMFYSGPGNNGAVMTPQIKLQQMSECKVEV